MWSGSLLRGAAAPVFLRSALAFLVFAAAAAVSGCAKYAGPPGRSRGTTAAIQRSAAAPSEGQEEEEPKSTVEIATERFRVLGARVETCLSDFVVGIDVPGLHEGLLPDRKNLMDNQCRLAIQAYREAARELLGRDTELDDYLRCGAAFSDAYLRMSAAFKGLAAADRRKVVEGIVFQQTAVLHNGRALIEAAAAVERWPAHRGAPIENVSRAVDSYTYQVEVDALRTWLSAEVPALRRAAQEFGHTPLGKGESSYVFSMRHSQRAFESKLEQARERFSALRCEGDADVCRTSREQIEREFEKAVRVLARYDTMARFYRGRHRRQASKAEALKAALDRSFDEFVTLSRSRG